MIAGRRWLSGRFGGGGIPRPLIPKAEATRTVNMLLNEILRQSRRDDISFSLCMYISILLYIYKVI
jgi:hypothetical protein